MVGGTEGRLQTEMPDSVAKVFTDSPEAAMVDHRRLRSRRDRDDARARDGLQRLHVPVDRGLRPVGRRRRRPVRAVQGQPRCGRVPRVPDDAGGRRDLGGARRLLVAEQEHRSRHISRRDHRRRRRARSPRRSSSASTCRTWCRRRSEERLERGCSRRSRTSWQNPDDIDGITEQMEADAAKAYSG